uniref:Ion transport domain-containing protein n=1 Tax=Hemiselmis andersenii TaxID=464988 RepID=A0A6U4S7N0_HEMAN|mmetsp:Transcript_39050/g.91190  ORF Transcript_39050/g.91190 Transcript_39050/m.91190 type:complete len:321 (+) Transcript_39050:146-1108(+)
MIHWPSTEKPKTPSLAEGLEPTCKCDLWKNGGLADQQGVKQRHTLSGRPEPQDTQGGRCIRCHLPVETQSVWAAHNDTAILVRPMAVTDSRMSEWEAWQSWALRILYSPSTKYYYGVMVVVNVGEIIATILRPNRSPHDVWFISLEVLVVFLLVAEVIVRAIAEQGKFLSSKSNIFDLFVAILCASMLVAATLMPSLLIWLPDWEKIAIVRIRDTLRVLRLVFLFKNHRKAQLVGKTLAPVQLRVDETAEGFDDESQRPLFGAESPAFGALDPAVDFGNTFKMPDQSADSLTSPQSTFSIPAAHMPMMARRSSPSGSEQA